MKDEMVTGASHPITNGAVHPLHDFVAVVLAPAFLLAQFLVVVMV